MKSGEHDDTLGAADTQAEVGRTGQVRWELEGYELKEVIGKGGMGEVVLARDTRMERDVALKRMLAAEPTPEAEARFLREAKIQATLDHPSIVPVHELGRDAEGRPYFVMKRLVGTTLAARLEVGGPTQPLLRALVDVCHAIDRAHSRRIIHRDLKPSNIMLGDFGEVYVLDWGVARVIDQGRPSAHDLTTSSPSDDGTKTGQMLGTPGYMAPEQMLGQDGVGTPADVYALGSILFEVLVGETLHPRGQEAIPSTLSNASVSPGKRVSDRQIPPELDLICSDALRTDPAARPSARELGDAIQRYLDGDRDLERRRSIALADLAIAERAFASGDRARTMRYAGRAMTLDPECTDAAELATRLVLEPPDQLPVELEARLAKEEIRQTRERSRRAIGPFLVFFVFLCFAPVIDIENWASLIFVTVVIGGQVVMAYVNWKVRPLPFAFYVVYQLLTLFAFSRFAGPFLLTPVLAGGILLGLTSVPWANDRPWFVVLWCFVATLIPVIAEGIGIADTSWHLSEQGVISYGTVFGHGTRADWVATVAGNLSLVTVIGVYALGIARDRRVAQRKQLTQAWHLEQLIPRAPRTMP